MWQLQKIVMIGFGSIGQALAPALIQDLKIPAGNISAICADENGALVAGYLGVRHTNNPLYPYNYKDILEANLNPGDWLINLSVNVSSLALIQWCQDNDVFYLDTCIEPWEGGYAPDKQLDATNYRLREAVLRIKRLNRQTAVVAHGANPGLVSHFAKAGLEAMHGGAKPKQQTWGELCQKMGVQTIQIAEQDTQQAIIPPDVFANTWSVDGFLSEALQRGEAGFGTHEIAELGLILHSELSSPTCIFPKSSADIKVRSWTPAGEHIGYLITHHEAISIASHFSTARYSPTVYYAYKPADFACRMLERWQNTGRSLGISQKQVVRDEIFAGADYLGVLLIAKETCFWYGSILSIAEARNLLPFNNATSCQVVGGIVGAMQWMIKNPRAGILEAEELPHSDILAYALPYLGLVRGSVPESFAYSDTSLQFFIVDRSL